MRRLFRWLFVRRLQVYPDPRVGQRHWPSRYRYEWQRHEQGWRWF